QYWSSPNCPADDFLRPLDLTAHIFVRHFGQVGMRPTMVSNLVTFPSRPLHDLGMLGDVFTDNKKGRVDMMLRQQIEQTRSQFFTRTIVKCQGDVRSIYLYGTDRDF